MNSRSRANPDFGRGESAYDKYWGDDNNPFPNPSLGPLQAGPFYAMEVVNGAFGTNGGVATDGRARVLDVDNRPIEGLYAAGNTTENAYAAGYPGAGAALGPIMTMGYLAGRAIAGKPRFRLRVRWPLRSQRRTGGCLR